MNKHPLAHGTIKGPKEDTGSPAKQWGDRYRAQQAKLKREQDQAIWLYNIERE
jgi:hypothetical protein